MVTKGVFMKKNKNLLPAVKKYFKANLHTHTNISDGALSPAEAKAAYKALGYQILALTDHNVVVNHSDMTDKDFLMLTAAEVNYDKPCSDATYHLNLIAERADNLWFPNHKSNAPQKAQSYAEKMICEGMYTEYATGSINEMIQKANEMGFLVTLNHPTWSQNSYVDYIGLQGLWGVEVRNSECCTLGYNENNHRVYDDLLKSAHRVYPLGADDMHSVRSLGHSWIMVGAEELNYSSTVKALKNGDFYMSCGPQIFTLTVEDDNLKITCSEAKEILLETPGRFARRGSGKDNTTISEATFNLADFAAKFKDNDGAYVKITVFAPDGTYAVTRAYYLNELLLES